VWDYSRPGWQMYRSGLEMYIPALPEEDVFDAYTHWYKPQSGDVVWDVGAHAGYWERHDDYTLETRWPDWQGHWHGNQILQLRMPPCEYRAAPTRQRCVDTKGTIRHDRDGAVSYGWHNGRRDQDFLAYPQACRDTHSVETLSLETHAKPSGFPSTSKWTSKVQSARWLNVQWISCGTAISIWAIEAHPIKGRYTSEDMEELFPRSGYEVYSSLEYEILFTWARPGCSRRHNCTRLSNDQLTISSNVASGQAPLASTFRRHPHRKRGHKVVTRAKGSRSARTGRRS